MSVQIDGTETFSMSRNPVERQFIALKESLFVLLTFTGANKI